MKLFATHGGVANSVPIADTSNYLSSRDGHIEALDAGETESVWMQEQLGRPLIKAWNGHTWSVAASPDVDFGSLYDASCPTPTTCYAVGLSGGSLPSPLIAGFQTAPD